MRLIAVAFSLLISIVPARAAEATFAGAWDTTYGKMTLTQQGDAVKGEYLMEGNRCFLDGKVRKNRLTFTYREPSAAGEGWFELAEGGMKFGGRWRENAAPEWAEWVGTRTTAALAPAVDFTGLWQTTYGRMRLVQEGTTITGIYSRGGGSTIEGGAAGNNLSLKYREPDVEGTATFQLSADGQTFAGKWKPNSSPSGGGSWSGERVAPKPGITWLVIVEARWENGLTDDEYTFGAMLRAFFARSSKVQVRHRFFSDETSLKRWCGELAYLAEPAVLVVASHGSTKGVQADGKSVTTKALAESLRMAGSLKLLHFSACELMKGPAAEEIMAGVPKPNRFPISGYKTTVDWAGSAVIEFAYLDMVLMRGMTPELASEHLLRLMPFAGTNGVPNSPFGNAGFRLLKPGEGK